MRDLVLEKNGKPLKVEFCCYKCYRHFWKGNKFFYPLKKWRIKNENV